MTAVNIALKDLRGALRSRFFIGMAVFVPLLVTALFFFAFGGGARGGRGPSVQPVRVGVVNLDQGGPLGGMVVQLLSGPQLSGLLRTSTYADTPAARAALSGRRIDAAVVIPGGFSAAVTADSAAAEVALLADPASTLKPAIVQAVVEQLLDGFAGSKVALDLYRRSAAAHGRAADSRGAGRVAAAYQRLAAGGEPISVRAPGGGEETVALFRRVMTAVFSGLMVFFAFYTAAYTALSLVREDEDGTLARLFTLPAGRGSILGGKLLSVFMTVALQATVLIAASTLLFGLRWGRLPSALMALFGMVAASSGFGVMLASFIRTVRQAGPVLGGGLSVAGMLGGLFTQAVPSMPAAFNRIALCLPQGWVMRGWNLAIAGRAPAELVVPLAVMLAMAAASFAVGVVVFRRRFG